MTIRFETVDAGDVSLNVASAGKPGLPLLVCLHGFPEYWAAWRDVAPFLSGHFHVVMPDQRGFNRSSKPESEEAYRVRHLVADVSAVADHYSNGQPFFLAGHDWGASVAYAFAFRNPARLKSLTVINGVHPWCFQHAILFDADQRRASQYISKLRSTKATEFMAADGFARTLNMMTGFSAGDWMTAEARDGYLEAWSEPGAMNAMLNWYRASPIVVPAVDEVVKTAPILETPSEAMRVAVRHQVIWGTGDQALRPVCLSGLERFAADLTIDRIDGPGHWIMHEQPDRVARSIEGFLAAE